MTDRADIPWRCEALAALSDEPLDVLLVGGGIVGAGIARDAALRGLRVGLIEQYDFAWGTSSRSSRLLHGGLRYLAQGRVGLVRQASVEKRIVHHIAPHLAAPLAFVFPTYRGTHWPRWKLAVGVKIYDMLCGGRNLGPSCTLSVAQLQQRVPGVDLSGATGGVRYFDGATNDARLVLDTLRSAARHGAIVCSHCRLVEARPEDGLWRCGVLDTHLDRSLGVTARCVVNATGPWAGQFERSRVRIRGTKGVHFVIDRARLPLEDAVMLADQRRIAYLIPWGQRLYMGTTDTDYDGPIEYVATSPQDVSYLLALVNRSFPDAGLTESDIFRTWAGVRPLVATKHGAPSDISRSHEIHLGRDGWVDVAGGKLTTYRLMARQVLDKIEAWLGRDVTPCVTDRQPLLPEGDVGFSAIVPPPVSRAVVEHCSRHEWALHLEDVMIRRTRWHHYHRDVHAIAEQVAPWMGDCLGWDAPTQAEEMERYKQYLD